jgi:hypothetical protein
MSLRDLGSAIVNITRPDGGNIVDAALSTIIPKGLVNNITDLNPAKAVDNLINGASTTVSNIFSPTTFTRDLPSVILNPLENFAHYTPLWTFACLEKDQFNNPDSYRNSPAALKHIVFASGGRYDEQRVQTASGSPEFYVNNFTMKSSVAPTEKTGNTNVTQFSWDVYEPYSMGLLLQSLQIAAVNAGYINYLNDTPYVLRLDFQGFDEEGRPLTSILPKFFVVKLTNVTFNVTEGGSNYKVEASPYNHSGFSDSVNVAFNDVSISGDPNGKGTVEELLVTGENSLVNLLNEIEERLVKDQQVQFPDIYDIQFPKSSSDFKRAGGVENIKRATVDPNAAADFVIGGTGIQAQIDFDTNEIGGSSLGFTQGSGGNFVMKKDDQRDPATGIISRDKMTINPKNRVFQFAQNQSLTSIINQVILSSEYASKAIDADNITPEGYIKWWRLDVQVELLDYDDWIGDYSKKFTYRVVPFYVHQSIFAPPSSAPIGYQELQKKIAKAYEYIYTGQNVDVLKFDIQINTLVFTGINPSSEKDSAKATDSNTAGGTAPQQNNEAKTTQGAAPGAQIASTGRRRVKRNAELIDQKIRGGDGGMTTERKVAEAFHKALTGAGSAELVNISLDILGDPYWLVDSGIANYFSPALEPGSQTTEDGTMNYEAGDIYVFLTFKTPVDINESTGLFDFPFAGKESPFSGIYKVTAVEHKFSDGTFKQTLTCSRMLGQPLDYANNPKEVNSSIVFNKQESLAKTITGPEKPKTSPFDDPGYNQTDADGNALF